MRKLIAFPVIIIVSSWLMSCQDTTEDNPQHLFTLLDSTETGIPFTNKLQFDKAFNIYTYRNYYNGGGVGIGDINNDGLVDIYFTGNMVSNKLYLNKGDFKFEDITEKAGVAGSKAWSTGVSIVDINADGLLDIYVCNSGDIAGDNKLNELFINNGDLTFTERAVEFNLADPGFSTHAAFFDYDKDGDLDVYILNNSYQAIGSFNLRKNIRGQRDPMGGDKLMRNDGGVFTDVSEEAGIYGSVIGFGLGATVGDVNNDSWPDIFVSNDFFERDYLYINNQDGTFSEQLTSSMQSISGASMGADLADINNDGNPEFFVTEMLPEDNARIKTVTTFEDWNRYQYNIQNGYFHQFTRNVLQLNNGDLTFSEVGRMAGVAATDWSWGALMVDLDNDGYKDIFVANGIYQDVTNLDFLQYASNEQFIESVVKDKSVDYKMLTEIIPSNPISNYAFKNNGNLGFTNQAAKWGLDQKGFSNGSAYADLDNDGDMDLVVNNVNMPCFVYRNEADKVYPENRFLKVVLVGDSLNKFGVGAKLSLEADDNSVLYLEQMPVRGFESTIDYRPNFGIGASKNILKLKVEWPTGASSEILNPKLNQTLVLNQKDAKFAERKVAESDQAIFSLTSTQSGLSFVHKENRFVDFDSDKLIYQMISREGPAVSSGDVNGDGLDDIFFGGAKGQSGEIFLQQPNGTFKKTSQPIMLLDSLSEDTASIFFDADKDGDLDLYVCSGGYEFSSSSTALIDRLYLNNGKGEFVKSKQVLPTSQFLSTSAVKAADYDNDGDMDLFVGARVRPSRYGLPESGFILKNNGKGEFENVTDEVAPFLKNIGMITDASWVDIDGDQDSDLIIVGEYMSVTVMLNNNGNFVNETATRGLINTAGWWNVVEASDVDLDGDIDLVVGNHGLNSRFKASTNRPVELYINDYDQNGSIEHILTMYNPIDSTQYPLTLQHDLIKTIPPLKRKYLKYETYKNEKMTDIFSPEQLSSALVLKAETFQTSVFINDGKGNFSSNGLPGEAQFSPIHAIKIDDFDGDGHPDILLGGNQFFVKPEVGKYDASFGLLLKGNGKGEFKAVPARLSGIKIYGEIRAFSTIKTDKGYLMIAARNNEAPVIYSFTGRNNAK